MRKLLKSSDSILKYLVAAILIAVPLYPKFPLLNIPGTFVAIRGEDILLALTMFIWFIFYFPFFKKFIGDGILRSMFLYLIIGLISLLSATLVLKTITPHIGILHLIRRAEYFAPFLLGFSVIKHNRSNIEFYFKILLLVLFFAFVYGWGQRYLGWPIVITQNLEYSKGVALRYVEGSHINSTFAGHYDLATFLVLVLPCIVSALFILKGRVSKSLLLIIWLSGLWLLVNTASRISLISYLGSATLALIFIKKYKFIPLVIIISLIFVLFSSNLQSRYGRLFEITTERIPKILYLNKFNIDVYALSDNGILIGDKIISPTPTPQPVSEDRSTSIRFNVEWPRAIRALLKNPLLGTGYSSITLATDNDYLRSLGETGILGLSAFILIFLNILMKFFQRFPLHKEYKDLQLVIVAGYLGSMPGLLLNALFIDIFEASKFAICFWIITGMVVSTLSQNE